MGIMTGKFSVSLYHMEVLARGEALNLYSFHLYGL